MRSIDFEVHNEEVREVMSAFRAGRPTRVPVILTMNPRLWLLDPKLNTEGISFQQYSESPDVMLDVQLKYEYFVRHFVPQDVEMGLPREWPVRVDFQTYYEAAWFGAPVQFRDSEVPDTTPILTDDRKNLLFDQGIPDPFTGGRQKLCFEFYEFLKKRKDEGFEFLGIPLAEPTFPGCGADGPFTVACNLRGATQMCIDLYEDPDYVRELLTYVTEAAILRIKAYRRLLNEPERTQGWSFADDSIQLISTSTYLEHVYPHHRRLIETFSEGGPNSIHLCGDATRHFPTLKEKLNILEFDTGFPVDFAWLRRTLGPEVHILGGPNVALLLRATSDEVDAEVKRILSSGIMEGGRFTLREGNNLSPCTPLENLWAMREAAKRYGRYE